MNNKYNIICIILLSIISCFLGKFFFMNLYVQRGYLFMTIAAVLLWILLLQNKNFSCNIILSLFLTTLYICVLAFEISFSNPTSFIFYNICLCILIASNILFMIVNYKKSNNKEL